MDWKERLKALMLENVGRVKKYKTYTTPPPRKPDPAVARVDMSPEAQRKYYSDMNKAEHGDIDNPRKSRKS